ncbi:autotransporter domain-containing protein [Mesorhizobium comanense]|uniref:autotransporter domain-containing protein n=1 Tax=Mesorhizobium comanense TaxID=2502215 RepID=UPI0014856190|nr:autotransporter domain-containing protein [Mesorhizobium comanense]
MLVCTALVGVVLIANDALAQSAGGRGGNGNGASQGGAGQTFGVAGTPGQAVDQFYPGAGGGGGAGAAGGVGGTVSFPGGSGGTAGANGTVGAPAGGQGGDGGNTSYGGGGGGGGGGNGVLLTSGSAQLITATGGNGGNGGVASYGAAGGGGSGGYGVGATGGALILNVLGPIKGGNGGAGGNGTGEPSAGGSSGSGGDGGGGIYFGSAGSRLNLVAGSVTGGTGGAGGVGGRGNGVSGRGGNGVDFIGVGNNIADVAAGTTIQGGNGGAGAAGGAGILGNGIAVTNLGTIAGGLSNLGAAGAVRADALTFTGGNNSLTLGNTSATGTITGNIGITGTLTIDPGTAAGGSVTLGNVIHDATTAGSIVKSGAGTLVLTGTNTYTGGTTFAAGILNAGSAGALGTSGTLSFTGGALQYSAANQTDYSGRFSTAAGQKVSVDTNGQNVTWASNLASSGGSLTKSGTGTLTLTGNNSLDGGVTIAGGTVNLGSAGALGTSGAITFATSGGGRLQYSANNQADISNRISTAANQFIGIDTNGQNVTFATTIAATGSSTLGKFGSGTLTLTAANATRLRIDGGSVVLTGSGSIAGDVYFTGGGLSSVFDISQTTSGATIGGLARLGPAETASGTVKLGSKTLTIDGNGLISTFVGVIEGTGGVTVAGGSLNLGNTNTYTGATTVQNGDLRLYADNAIAASSELNLSGEASVELNTATATIQTLRGVAASTVYIQDKLKITNGSTSYAGVLADSYDPSSLIIAGGHQTLDGVNTYTGTTTVEDGATLTVNGSIASSSMTTVQAGGTLGGIGTVGNVTVDGGTLAPGSSTGTLTVQGDLSLTSQSTYLVDVSPTSAARVDVTGTAGLNGATLRTSYAPGSYVARQYTILTADGGVDGTFSGPVSSNLPSSIKQTVSYDPEGTGVYLDTELSFVVPGGLNGNQQAVANALMTYFDSTGGIPVAFAALSSEGLSQASGETATGLQQTTFNAMDQFLGVLGDRSLQGRAPGGDITASVGDMPSSRWNVWATPFGFSNTTDGDPAKGSNTLTSRLYGLAVGADYRLSPDTLTGFAVAGGASSFNVGGFGSGRTDLFQAGAFIHHDIGAGYIDASLAYGWQDAKTERSVGADRLEARLRPQSFAGRLEGGYRFDTPWIDLTPYTAAQFATLALPAYSETAKAGADTFALSYDSKNLTATRAELGLRTNKSFFLDDKMVTLRGRVAWAHDFDTDRNVTATFQALPGATFVTSGAERAADALLTSASAEMKFNNGWTLSGTIDGEFSKTTHSYAGRGAVRYAW